MLLSLGRVLERQRANEQEKMLPKELNHRVGNTLAVIQSMFRRSASTLKALTTWKVPSAAAL
jgi:two-component sensor histidine kinase